MGTLRSHLTSAHGRRQFGELPAQRRTERQILPDWCQVHANGIANIVRNIANWYLVNVFYYQSMALIAWITCAISEDAEMQYLDRMSAQLASRLNGLKKTRMSAASRKRVVEKQSRSFFSTKKKHAKREEWRNPTTEEKEEIVHKLEDYIVID